MFLITVLGLAAVVIMCFLNVRESDQRIQQNLARLHTRFVALNCELEPVYLTCSDILIGRMGRRCDISLSHLINEEGRSPVSKIHARLWWDGENFRIAPVLSRKKKGAPVVKVNGWVAPPEEGLVVNYNDVITLTNQNLQFTLENTELMPLKDLTKVRVLHRERPTRTAEWYARRRALKAWGAMALAVVLILSLVLGPMAIPRAKNRNGLRKRDTATILVCGVDGDKTRTDTMILVYLSGKEKRMSMLSIPRDILTEDTDGKLKKLNAIYDGGGKEDVEELLDVITRYIGYRPDGYLLFDWNLVKDVTDIMGGVDVNLRTAVSVKDPDTKKVVKIPEGENHLDGEQTLAAVRFREGYEDADGGRMKTQRQVIKACMEQWLTLDKLGQMKEAIDLVMDRSVTNLTMQNYIWMAKTALKCEDTSINQTLAGSAEYRNGAWYYILNPRSVAYQISEYFNPFREDITRDKLQTIS